MPSESGTALDNHMRSSIDGDSIASRETQAKTDLGRQVFGKEELVPQQTNHAQTSQTAYSRPEQRPGIASPTVPRGDQPEQHKDSGNQHHGSEDHGCEGTMRGSNNAVRRRADDGS